MVSETEAQARARREAEGDRVAIGGGMVSGQNRGNAVAFFMDGAEYEAAHARRATLEEVARVIEGELKRISARIVQGKGEWPKQGYVRDEVWASFQGQEYALRDLARRIRALLAAMDTKEANNGK